MNGRCVRFRCDIRENEYSIAAVSTGLRPGSLSSASSSISRVISPTVTVAGTSFTGGMAICIASGCPCRMSSRLAKSASTRDAGTSALLITWAASAARSGGVSGFSVIAAWATVSQPSSGWRLSSNAELPAGPSVTSLRNADRSGNSDSSSKPAAPSGKPATFSVLSQTSNDGLDCRYSVTQRLCWPTGKSAKSSPATAVPISCTTRSMPAGCDASNAV